MFLCFCFTLCYAWAILDDNVILWMRDHCVTTDSLRDHDSFLTILKEGRGKVMRKIRVGHGKGW